MSISRCLRSDPADAEVRGLPVCPVLRFSTLSDVSLLRAARSVAGSRVFDVRSRSPVQQCLGDVIARQTLGAGEVGDRSRNADDAIEAACAQTLALHHAFEQCR